jgi:hypothetical protein
MRLDEVREGMKLLKRLDCRFHVQPQNGLDRFGVSSNRVRGFFRVGPSSVWVMSRSIEAGGLRLGVGVLSIMMRLLEEKFLSFLPPFLIQRV